MITPPIYSFNLFSPEPLDLEDFDGEDDVIDLRAYHVVGGVYHFNLLHLPPQPKNVNDWVITQVRGEESTIAWAIGSFGALFLSFQILLYN